jgi:hypothetical protein
MTTRKPFAIFLISILSLPLICAAKKDPCQAVDAIKLTCDFFYKYDREDNDSNENGAPKNKKQLKGKTPWKDPNSDRYYLINKDGDQIIMFELGCDCYGVQYPMVLIMHNQQLPRVVRKQYYYLSLNSLQKISKHTITIDDNFFSTKKGVHLGMGIDEVLKVYGKPDSIKVLQKNPNIIVKYKWEILSSEEAVYREQAQVSDRAAWITEKMIQNDNKSLTDRVYENNFGPKKTLPDDAPSPIHQLAPKRPAIQNICKTTEISMEIKVIFFDGKANLIEINFFGE